MRTSNEIKACLQHDAYELCQVQELSATSSGHVQTATDGIHMSNSHANLIKPTIDAQIRQIHGLSEEIVRVYALRSNESDAHLKNENAQLKQDVVALREALRLETEQHQAHLTDFARSERFNTQLKVWLKEMKDKYEDAIIENLDLKDPNKALQSTLRKHRKGLPTAPPYPVLTPDSCQRCCKQCGFQPCKQWDFSGTDALWQDSGRNQSRSHCDNRDQS